MHESVERSGAKVVMLEGDLSVEHARKLRDLLLDTLKNSKQVILEFGDCSGSDLSFLQLLCSAHRTALRWGVSLKLRGKVATEILNAAEGAGYLREKCCSYSTDSTCLWLKRGLR